MISKTRIAAGLFAFLLLFLILSLIPISLQAVVEKLLPNQIANEVVPIINRALNPFLPIIGAMLAIFTSLGIIFKKTRAYGIIVVISSLLWLCYIYSALHGGHIKIIHPMLSVDVDLSFFMLIIFIPIFLDLIRGIILIVKRSELKI